MEESSPNLGLRTLGQIPRRANQMNFDQFRRLLTTLGSRRGWHGRVERYYGCGVLTADFSDPR
jgi:hypothetical protein